MSQNLETGKVQEFQEQLRQKDYQEQELHQENERILEAVEGIAAELSEETALEKTPELSARERLEQLKAERTADDEARAEQILEQTARILAKGRAALNGTTEEYEYSRAIREQEISALEAQAEAERNHIGGNIVSFGGNGYTKPEMQYKVNQATRAAAKGQTIATENRLKELKKMEEKNRRLEAERKEAERQKQAAKDAAKKIVGTNQ